MLRVTCLALTIALAAAASPAQAQTVRFQTSVGAFVMLLNPTNNEDLQPLVDNMLANVAAGVYQQSVINRADSNVDGEPFVLQLGGFFTDNFDPDLVPVGGFAPVDRFDPVIVDANNDGAVDFDTTGLTNSIGTVSLALAGGNPNSGTSSFFVNLNDNSFLDDQGFVPFATIADMATVDRIFNSTLLDLTAQVGQPGNLAFEDVPVDANGELIYLETVSVVSESNFSFIGPLQQALGIDDAIAAATAAAPFVGPLSAEAVTESEPAIAFASSSMSSSPAFSAAATAIPEPATLLIVLGSLAALATRR
ncbi:MAG: peptidylprolyl isomerase [Planctomycetota bacterium]